MKVCDSWQKYKNFENDMYPTFQEGLTLDRIDNNKDYELSNCKWSTKKEQANNRRTSRWVTIDGQTKTLAQWINESPVKKITIEHRIYLRNWPVEKALEVIK